MLFLLTILYYENCVFLTFAPFDLIFEIGGLKNVFVPPVQPQVHRTVPVLMSLSTQTMPCQYILTYADLCS